MDRAPPWSWSDSGGVLGQPPHGARALQERKGPSKPGWSLALAALLECGLESRVAGCRPARREVADQGLGPQLLDTLGACPTLN